MSASPATADGCAVTDNACTIHDTTPVKVYVSADGIGIVETDTEIGRINQALGPAGDGDHTQYRVFTYCENVADGLPVCRTQTTCTTTDGKQGVLLRMEHDTNGDNTFLTVTPTPCQPLEGATSLAALDADVQRALLNDLPIAASTLTLQPPGGTTLTGLPSLFRAEPPAGATTDRNGVAWTFPYAAVGGAWPVTVTGHPTYTWDFGDGQTLQTTAPGTLFTGTDPRSHPETYPVSHTWTTAGTRTVTETTTWRFTYRTPTGDVRTVTDPVVRTTTAQVAVTTARARLVEPDHG